MYRNRVAAGFCALLLAPATWASVDWEWSFTQATVNLALSPSVYLTLTNLATSDESITDARIDFMTLGTYGVLVDPSNGSVLTATLRDRSGLVAPGQSVTFEAFRFFFGGPVAPGLPSNGFQQVVAPSMIITSCPNPVYCTDSKPSPSALTLTYVPSPVPEPATWGLMFAGLVGVGRLARRLR